MEIRVAFITWPFHPITHMSAHVICTEKRCIVFPHQAICLSVRTPAPVTQVQALSIFLHFHLASFPLPSICPLCSSSVCASYFPALTVCFSPMAFLWLPSIVLSFPEIRTTAVLGSCVKDFECKDSQKQEWCTDQFELSISRLVLS